MSSTVVAITTVSQILASGIVILAASLLLYALTFNLRERVARSFAVLAAMVTVTYFCDVLVSTLGQDETIELWLRVQWLGIGFMPVAFLHFSDAVLASTGRPSRGRRRLAIRVLYVVNAVFVGLALFSDWMVRTPEVDPLIGAAHLNPGPLFWVYISVGLAAIVWAAWNFQRAYARSQTATTRRRMVYLIASAIAPLVGTFPFLLVVGQEASLLPLTFSILSILSNVIVSALLIAMAYTVAFYGVALPDRVVKGRFFQWLLRGPLVASAVLAVFVVVRRFGPQVPFYDERALPFFLIAVLLLLQFFITLVRLPIERRLFYGVGGEEVRRLAMLEERLLTTRDLQQFFESVLANLVDGLRAPGAFLVALDDQGRVAYEVAVGVGRPDPKLPPLSDLHPIALDLVPPDEEVLRELGALFVWGDSVVVPLRPAAGDAPLGLLGVRLEAGLLASGTPWRVPAEQAELLATLVARAELALEDWRLQQGVFRALDRVIPSIEAVQRLRASAYPDPQQLGAGAALLEGPDLPVMVRDALRDYGVGSRLAQSPLQQLAIVQRALTEHDGNAANALREVLRTAIERIKPEGQRKTTGEWLLYNILEMKFLQGQKVRDIALRLAVSEADFYRKQRLALEEAASAIVQMEREALRSEPTP